jgi:energy-coupling factor transporter ATP-binding protein EcfA2
MYKVNITELHNESDVEQKVLFPLITKDEPEGLGYQSIHIQTKSNLKKIEIEKGDKAKLYFPDYILLPHGIPTVIIEAKKPGEDLNEAFREARLYATEVNALYKKNINPCSFVIASDGTKLLAGSWDDSNPKYEIDVDDWLSTDKNFSGFLKEFSLQNTKKFAESIRDKIRTKVRYKKPIHGLGGKHIQNRQINNSFGETLSLNHRHLFNPTEEAERVDIVNNAYIKIPKHLAHVNPIDRLIRKKVRPSIQYSKILSDDENNKEIIQKLSDASKLNNEVMLLIGSVGSGKSTFTTYLKEIALNDNIKNKLLWIRIDLNNSPVAREELYKWIKKDIINSLKNTDKEFDPDTINGLKELYEIKIDTFNKVALELFPEETTPYKEKLFQEIKRLKADIDLTLDACISHYVHKKGKNLILVLDNCDKRNSNDQLLMFEIANYLKENTKSVVFLPLRETTYDHYQNQKPLDTVVKDLTFRINPPSLERVLYSRIKYSMRAKKESNENHYYLENGMQVSYPSEEEIFYLKSILKSLFQNDFFKKLISGLAGRNIRKGIEIFLDFCKSGHITDSFILKMKHSKGEFSLPNHIISKVMIRGNRLYYTDSESRIKNLFISDPADSLPDPFVRVGILVWLRSMRRKKGPSGITGFHKISKLINELMSIGHSEFRIIEELKTMVRESLVITESQDEKNVNIEELICIDIPGIVHLNLLNNLDYLSSCAEDMYYNDLDLVESITKRIAGLSDYSHFSLQTTLANAESLLNYLESIDTIQFKYYKEYIDGDGREEIVDFKKLKQNIEDFKVKIKFNDHKELEFNSKIKGIVVNAAEYGLICEIDGTTQTGLLHVSNMSKEPDEYDIGDELDLIVKKYKPKYSKYDLMELK